MDYHPATCDAAPQVNIFSGYPSPFEHRVKHYYQVRPAGERHAIKPTLAPLSTVASRRVAPRRRSIRLFERWWVDADGRRITSRTHAMALSLPLSLWHCRRTALAVELAPEEDAEITDLPKTRRDHLNEGGKEGRKERERMKE